MLSTSPRNLARAALVASALATFAAPARSAETLGSYGLWTSVVSGSGRDRVCGMRTEMTRGGSVSLAMRNGKVHLLLWHPRWDFARGDQIRLSIDVDGRGFSGTGNAKDSMIVAENLSESFLDAFLAGRQMEIELPGRVQWTLDLSGSQAAARDMVRCAAGSGRI